MSDKPVARLLKKLVDILAAVLKGVIESKVKFEQACVSCEMIQVHSALCVTL